MIAAITTEYNYYDPLFSLLQSLMVRSEIKLSESEEGTEEDSLEDEVAVVQATPTPPPPQIETVQSAASTEDPDYDQ